MEGTHRITNGLQEGNYCRGHSSVIFGCCLQVMVVVVVAAAAPLRKLAMRRAIDV